MVRNFKGIVKISEVKDEFDKLVNDLNSLVDEYNNIEGLKDIDYNKAGSTLAQLGYTLTVGGLKQFMQIYDGYCFGCRVFKTANNQCRPTGGILVTSDKFYRIPTDLVSGYGTMLFYNPTTNKCQVGGATKTWKTFSQPAINSNTKFGTISATSNSGKAYMCTKPPVKINSNPDVYTGAFAFTGKGSKVSDGGVQRQDTLTWKFPSNIDITQFSFGIYLIGGFRYNFRIRIRNYNNSILYDSGLIVSSLLWNNNIRISPNKQMSGIKIEIITTNYTDNPALVSLSNVLIKGKQRVWSSGGNVPKEVIKIADLNWEKTSNDKLWLNDLPNSMY